MSELLDRAVDIVRALPADERNEIARVMLALADTDDEPEPVDPRITANYGDTLLFPQRIVACVLQAWRHRAECSDKGRALPLDCFCDDPTGAPRLRVPGAVMTPLPSFVVLSNP